MAYYRAYRGASAQHISEQPNEGLKLIVRNLCQVIVLLVEEFFFDTDSCRY